MASTSPTTSPTISCVIPCSLTPRRRISSSSSPPSSPLLPSTPPMTGLPGSYEPEYITNDATPPPQWGVSRLVRFDNECIVIPESEWFASPYDGSGEGSSSKGGFKAVFGLNKMKKKVVVVNRSYSLSLWPAGGSGSSSKSPDDEVTTGESGTEDEATHQRKVVRLNFKVPIPTFSPERPPNASRHPHLRSPSLEYPSHSLPSSPRGRKSSRSRSPSTSSPSAIPLSPILMHRSLSPEVSRSPVRGLELETSPAVNSSPLEIARHPHNALYTNPRMDPVTSSYFPVSSSPPSPRAQIHTPMPSASPSTMDSAVFAALPELIPLRPCCEDCSKSLEDALRQGEEWKEKFSRGAKQRRRRSSSAASTSSVASSVVAVDGGGGPTATITAASTVIAHPTAVVIDAVPVVTPAKRPVLTVSTAPTIPSTCVEETDEELEAEADAEVDTEAEVESADDAAAEPVSAGKLTMAVVDEVEGLKRRSASGSSLSKVAALNKPVSPPPATVDKHCTGDLRSRSSLSATSSSQQTPASSTPRAPSTTRKFLDVPAFQAHGRVASGGSLSSLSSNGSGDSVGSGGSDGSAGSKGSAGSRSSARSNGNGRRSPPKSILKNSPSSTPLPSPSTATPPRSFKRHSYHGTPRDKRREEQELLMANTLQNMNIGGKGRGRERDTKRTSPTVIDLSQAGDPRRKVMRECHLGGKARSVEDDDDMLFPLPRSPKGSPGSTPDATPGAGNTPHASIANTPRASNTPELLTPRGGSPRVSPRASPYASPRISPRFSPLASPNLSPQSSPRASPRTKPSPLAVVSPVMANSGIEIVQGGVGGDSDGESGDGVIKGSITRKGKEAVYAHSRTVSEPSIKTSTGANAGAYTSPKVTLEGEERKHDTTGHHHSNVADYFNIPHPHMQASQSQQRNQETRPKQKQKQKERSISTGSPGASPSSSSLGGKLSGAENSPRQGRKNTTSFSAFGRNLRGLGADIMKGVGSIGGMGTGL